MLDGWSAQLNLRPFILQTNNYVTQACFYQSQGGFNIKTEIIPDRQYK